MKRFLLALAAWLAATTPAFAQTFGGAGGSTFTYSARFGSNPFAAGTQGSYISSVDNKLHFVNNAGSDTALGSGGGGSGTLPTDYSNGSAGPQVLALDSTRLGLELDGYASQTTPLLDLKLGATPGTGNYHWRARDSGGTVHAYLASGGVLWIDAVNGGVTLDTSGGGASLFTANIMQNTTAATSGLPVQQPGAFEWSGNVWDTGGAANKTGNATLTLSLVSGNPAYEELVASFGGTAATAGRGLTLSTGASTAATVGLALLNATSATPTLYTTGAFTEQSAVADGSSSVAHIRDTVASWTTTGAKLWSLRSAGSEKVAVTKLASAWTLDFAGIGSYRTGTVDGSSAVAHQFDTVNSFVTAGAKLASFRNATTEELYVDKAGIIGGPSGNPSGGSVTILSEHADGASAQGLIVNTTTTWSTSGGHIAEFQTGGSAKGGFGLVGTSWSFFTTAGGGYWESTGAAGMRVTSSSQIDWYTSSSLRMEMSTTGFYPTTTHGLVNGKIGQAWASTASRQYFGEQPSDIANAASVTITVGNGETQRVLAGTTAMTINGTAGTSGEVITVCVVQDATGGRTATFATGTNNFALAGSTYTPSGANKRDCITFRWDTGDTIWHEIARALNQSATGT